ncbi:hypothetical protein H6770_03645 [Candidatus Peribacteria bacterium]|nr:hypothetical protein [Candidatus Peribacteria bacterium]
MGRRPYTPRLNVTIAFIEDEEEAWEAVTKAVAVILAVSPEEHVET